ncbi:MAG TPA: hypothetical protein VMD75_08905 [Candidatus Binataceae bacterium]|nr:hypothetical protein [Candidatus Binataceae bacterium]
MARAIDRWVIAVAALLAGGSPAWAGPPPIAPADACPAISRAVGGLAAAEHQQAFALDLYSKAEGGAGPHRGALPAVEIRLAAMLERIGDLRATLERVRSAPGALGNSTVEQCLEVGEAALRRGERVSSEVERVVIEARGDQPKSAALGSIKLSAPAAHSSPGSTSEPVPPGDVER